MGTEIFSNYVTAPVGIAEVSQNENGTWAITDNFGTSSTLNGTIAEVGSSFTFTFYSETFTATAYEDSSGFLIAQLSGAAQEYFGSEYIVFSSSNLSFSTSIPASESVGSFFGVACFAAGTRIASEHGDVLVEHLVVGDRVRAKNAGLASIKWIGHRTFDCARHPDPQAIWPVRVSRGAFAAETPHRDLWLSPDHAVLINGVLIPIKHLVNDRTIAQERWEAVCYFHIELDRHDILLAEGLPCESFLDTGNRSDFENGGPAMRLHPDFAVRTWDAKGCAPLVVWGAELQAARAALLDRAASVEGQARRAVA